MNKATVIYCRQVQTGFACVEDTPTWDVVCCDKDVGTTLGVNRI